MHLSGSALVLSQESLFRINRFRYGTSVLAHDIPPLGDTREGIRLAFAFRVTDEPTKHECAIVICTRTCLPVENASLSLLDEHELL